jgi:hypothetical protein
MHEGQTPNPAAAPEGGTTPAPAARPEYIPEKFWDASAGAANVEALAKSYAELEKKIGAPKEPAQQQGATIPDPPAPVQEPPAQQPAEGEDTPATQAAIDDANAELATNGDFTPETVEKLKKAGLDPEHTKEAFKAVQTVALQRAASLAGGEDEFNAAVAWAQANMAPAEIAAYNETVSKRGTFDIAVEGLMARYRKANGTEGNSVTANSNGLPATTDQSTFGSHREMTDAIGSVQYREDPKYRAEIEAKVQRTRRAGTIRF